MPRKIEVSHKTIIFTIAFIGLIWFLYQISSILLGLFVSILLMTAFNPIVDRLNKLGVPRSIAIFIVYILFIGLVVGGITSIVPPLIDQSTNLANNLPTLFDQAGTWLDGLGIEGVDGKVIAGQISQLGAIPANLIKLTIALFSNIVTVFSVLVVTFYLLLERKNLDNYLVILFGKGEEEKAKSFVDRVETSLGGWVRGELILMVIIGVLTFVGLTLLGIPYALPLAILAGILEIVPTIGPVLSSIPAILLGLTVSPIMAIATVALYFLIQQLENSVIVPNVMRRATGINPLFTIIVLAIGLKLAGVIGAILAVPILIVLRIIAIEIFSLKQLQKI
ncbi:MAG: hypothetical protein A3D24_03570 [Candidatus Blackburnbacteria bacterium RIFCSPHIGHO2_02_FULL_39_13]|uniref:AI-2E family transporter n=1 Tax=Candidatus Blackburnbacteria bacterium RIFCSPLOWO2_01_FULL_40_20 TaxID=1797519 RepID=A0A1G1VEN8_9BACT|nr:MAG: hypothetical protein UT38_C0018G0002 [Microgenomates group bacterium GW2011_GWA2_39_19]OGY07153.1 MAG: hypothetical protein A2694_01170 [Candidatus Blackburnbacteria bacterium RIFCSPHIGHO2_01_FULL_40_17]OGY09983.1 MAG: hypothetical protein A3D24_03570 [Candidatus Blackburnbacteria bacterium RIFCSPHIGHO2_02_FULL_39_13]OGY13829.1 MAG: hypothetical protein A3A77_03555 [Candidatus Blackburnbacteria bacterium RIFCSPLOWO2_01_FULL_40_20]